MSSAPLPTYSKVCFCFSTLHWLSLCAMNSCISATSFYTFYSGIFLYVWKMLRFFRLYFLVIHRFVHSFTFIVTWRIKQSVLLATFRGGFLNRGYLWCKWSRLLSLEIQTQILRPYLLIWILVMFHFYVTSRYLFHVFAHVLNFWCILCFIGFGPNHQTWRKYLFT